VTSPETSTHQQIDELHAEEHHPSPRQYVKVAIVLFIITALEVAIYYIPAINSRPALLVSLLIVFGIVKFSLVVLWFMHLKFDSPLFKRLFVTGVAFALIVFAIVIATFVFRDDAAVTETDTGSSSSSSE
jgi:cytochrome c oxidase subunit IV